MAWALVALLFEVLLIYLALDGLPLAMANAHGSAPVLAALLRFIAKLALVATLPPHKRPW